VLVRFSTRLPVGSANNFHPTMTAITAVGDDPTCFHYMETSPLTSFAIEEAKYPHQNNCNNKKSSNYARSTPKHVKIPVAAPTAAAPTTIHHY